MCWVDISGEEKMDKLLKFDGRIRRMGWWIAGIGVSIVSGVFNRIFDEDSNILVLLIVLVISIAIWLVSLSLSVRRWHDHNKSGWWVLINLIPILGWIYSLVMLGFMPGDQGHNNYGPPPEEGAIL
jgi:uncharacterized membrane protein YhaH (DUF805 family)